jgi:hypothetical protein
MEGHSREREEARRDPVVIDLFALEKQAEELFLHRFVEHVRQARRDNGRFLTMRGGDVAAIEAAADGSAEMLEEVLVEEKDPLGPPDRS